MGAGVLAAYVLPMWALRIFSTFNGVFSNFLGFIIPLLIVGFVAPAIIDIGARAGKMLLFTVILAYVATFGAGMFSYFTSVTFFPSMIQPVDYAQAATASSAPTPYFSIDIAEPFSVMTALVGAFVFGLALAHLPQATVLRSCFNDLRSVIDMVIRRVIVPLLPLYILGIFSDMTASGNVGPIMMTFIKIIAVIFVMHVVLLVAQYVIASFFSGKNPLRSLLTMMPAYFTALGTQSSAATIPVTLKQTIKMGVNKDVAGFVIPLCATIHMSGSTLKIVACALALMMSLGHHYDFGMFAGFIAMLGITIVAAPGVPGGAIMASLGLLSGMLGFTDADNALMIALYIAMDSFGTACNVTGDGALAQIVNRFFGRKAAA